MQSNTGDLLEFFDEPWYRLHNIDLIHYDGPLIDHYLKHGRFEKRAPGPRFDPKWYSDLYGSDLHSLDECSHYIEFGRKKGYHPAPPYTLSERRIEATQRDTIRTQSKKRSAKRCGILIRTYEDDAFRLYYTLASIAKFCSGFDDVVVVCQAKAVRAIEPVVNGFSFVNLRVCPSYSNDYIGQQVTKLLSYDYIDSEIIVHVDSDCVFLEAVDISHYIKDEKPIMFYRTYNEIYRNFLMAPWQEPTSRFLLRQVDHEFMCGFPIVHPRKLYIDLHDWFRRNHQFDYQDIHQHLTGPTAFSEFNLLGAFSFYSEYDYHFYDDCGGAGFDFKSRQFCRGMNRADRRLSPTELNELEAILT